MRQRFGACCLPDVCFSERWSVGRSKKAQDKIPSILFSYLTAKFQLQYKDFVLKSIKLFRNSVPSTCYVISVIRVLDPSSHFMKALHLLVFQHMLDSNFMSLTIQSWVVFADEVTSSFWNPHNSSGIQIPAYWCTVVTMRSNLCRGSHWLPSKRLSEY